MHILKSALLIGGLLMACQALAHKASHVSEATVEAARPTTSRIDTDPAALLGEVGGRSVQSASALPGAAPVQAPARNHTISARINRRH